MTGSRLAALLDQATSGPWHASGRRITEMHHRAAIAHVSDFYATPIDARLIALAPDMARLLVDMAAEVDYLASFTPGGSARDGRLRPLLARFAELDEKAGAA